MNNPRPGDPPCTDAYLLTKDDETLHRIYRNVTELHAEYPTVESFLGYVKTLKAQPQPLSQYGLGLTQTPKLTVTSVRNHAQQKVTTKQFPLTEKCGNAWLIEADGSPVLLKALWNKFPSVRHEFTDFENFKAYGQSVAQGKSFACGTRSVISSRLHGLTFLTQ